MIARYDGYCTRCGESITAGWDEIVPDEDLGPTVVWRHEVCPHGEADRRARNEVCGECFLVKPCPCGDNQ